jgi:3-dehydroquinate synthase
MNKALKTHKELMEYPRNGEGSEAYVDASDTGYTVNAKMEEENVC